MADAAAEMLSVHQTPFVPRIGHHRFVSARRGRQAPVEPLVEIERQRQENIVRNRFCTLPKTRKQTEVSAHHPVCNGLAAHLAGKLLRPC